MFGKARDINDTDTLDSSALDGFFGDEAAAEKTVEIHDLRGRVEQVESQINSQFTSLATYAQIAQEQVELARSEARAATERSEQRMTSLIERERADRITASTGVAPEGSPDLTSRLDALEHSVARHPQGPRRLSSATEGPRPSPSRRCSTASPPPTALPAPTLEGGPVADRESLEPPSVFAAPVADRSVDASGPISGLALNG